MPFARHSFVPSTLSPPVTIMSASMPIVDPPIPPTHSIPKPQPKPPPAPPPIPPMPTPPEPPGPTAVAPQRFQLYWQALWLTSGSAARTDDLSPWHY
jgi:hypothetical protein